MGSMIVVVNVDENRRLSLIMAPSTIVNRGERRLKRLRLAENATSTWCLLMVNVGFDGH